MKAKKKNPGLKKRIQSGNIWKRDVSRRLAELAFGRVNDCVKLALEEDPALETLDLCLLSEVKRSEKGTVEVKLIDRLKVLEQLAAVVGEDGTEMEGLLEALRGGEKG